MIEGEEIQNKAKKKAEEIDNNPNLNSSQYKREMDAAQAQYDYGQKLQGDDHCPCQNLRCLLS